MDERIKMLSMATKLIVSLFVFLLAVILFFKRITLAALIIPNVEGKLEKYFIMIFLCDFSISISCFTVILLWVPTTVQKNFFVDPYPAIVGSIVCSVIFALVGAYGAINPTRTIRLLRKLKNVKKRKN